MPELIEARVNDAVFRFDGEILELFDLSTIGGGRYLVELLGGIEIDRDMLMVTAGDTTTRHPVCMIAWVTAT